MYKSNALIQSYVIDVIGGGLFTNFFNFFAVLDKYLKVTEVMKTLHSAEIVNSIVKQLDIETREI